MSAPLIAAREFVGTLRCDLSANRRDPKSMLILTALRVTQLLMGDRDRPRVVAYPAIAMYRLMTEFVLGLEVRPKTRIGPGLTIYHGFGIVINDNAVIGRGVTVRNAVTIGHLRPSGGCPRIGDNVEIGVGAIVLGDITIGEGARIGAGALVVKDVPAGGTVYGSLGSIRP